MNARPKTHRESASKKLSRRLRKVSYILVTCIVHSVNCSNVDDLPSKCSRNSPPKSQFSRSLKRRLSVSMPGSLFPRSPSLEPDADPSSAEKEQHVRFALHVSEPLNPPPSPQRRPKSKSMDGSASTTESPRRRSQIASSVKTVVDKFHIGQDDADSSILLPSPKRSPHALVASRNLQSRRVSSPSSPSAAAMKYKSNNHSVESFSDDCGDTSGVLRVKGKEKELVAAREEFYRNKRRDNETPALSIEQVNNDRDRDKIRIKMLEEEIERLKQEVSEYFRLRISMLTGAKSYRRDLS